jgi:predicted transcriptional regulator
MPAYDEPLGQLELAVLRHIAGQDSVTVREVADHFAETTGQARTTILTVMERLRSKRYLTRRKVGGVQRYTSTISKARLLDRMVGGFVADVLEGAVSPFLAYLTRSAALSKDEMAQLNTILTQIESRESKEKS